MFLFIQIMMTHIALRLNYAVFRDKLIILF